MILTKDMYNIQCDCGHPHAVFLEKAVIEPGALYKFDDEVAALNLPQDYTAIYDKNTYAATQGRHPKATYEIILNPDGLHANEHGVQQLMDALKPTKMLVAVGSGTVHDLTRYCAAKLNLPFASAPTAASMDGFASYSSSMTLKGMKVTVPAVSPTLIVADSEIVAAAPWRLTCSGIGDILGKYIALCDWKISNLLTGEYYCAGIEELTRKAVNEIVECAPRLHKGDTDAYDNLLMGLVFAGLSMQLTKVSRPAAGAEHYISHLMELGLDWLPVEDALHGEKVGVATLLCATIYHQLAQLTTKQVEDSLIRYQTPTKEELTPIFGKLSDEVLKENADDCLYHIPDGSIVKHWDKIQKFINEIPAVEEIAKTFTQLGAKTTLASLDVDPALQPQIIHWSGMVRNRLTLLRIQQYMMQQS